MTTFQALLAFTLAAGLLTLSPGVDTALILRTGAVEGARQALLAALGICAGCLAWGVLVAAGLGVLLAASELAYAALRLAGAGYLIYLGAAMMLRRARTVPEAGTDAATGTAGTGWFARGLLTNLLNPKIGVFYVTFLPQFVPAGVGPAGFTLLLASVHVLLGLVWFAALVGAARTLGGLVRRPAVARLLDRVTGAVLVGFGLRLALEARR